MAVSASSKVFSPPWASHSKNLNGLLTPVGPTGKSVPKMKFDPVPEGTSSNQKKDFAKQYFLSAMYGEASPPTWSIAAIICMSNVAFRFASAWISATQLSQTAFLFSHSLRLKSY
jgi:hypothetical protein